MARNNSSWTDFSKVDKMVDQMMVVGLKSLGDDVKKRAVILAPKASGDLRQSAKVNVSSKGDRVIISFNTAYSRLRHYVNFKNRSTKYYLTNSLKSITNVSKYFRRIN